MKTRSMTAAAALALTLSACTPSTPPGTGIGYDPFTPGSPKSNTDSAEPQQSVADDGHTNHLDRFPSITRASGELHLLLDEEAAIPQALIDDFEANTRVKVNVVSLASSEEQAAVDAYIGFDEYSLTKSLANAASQVPAQTPASHPIDSLPAAVDYARDDVCILADQQWFAINRLQAPANMAAIIDPANAKFLTLAPGKSATAYAFTKHVEQDQGAQAQQWLGKLQAGAYTPENWGQAAEKSTVRIKEQAHTQATPGRPQWAGSAPVTNPSNADSAGDRPLRVAPVSVVARSVTNTQTSGYMRPIEGSCAQRYLYLLPANSGANPDAVAAFTEYILSPRGQRILAQYGAAIPLDPANASDTPIAWYTQN